MKRLLIIFVLTKTITIYSQNTCESKIQELKRAMNQELEKSNGLADGVQSLRNSEISGKYFELISKAEAECSRMKQKQQGIDEENYNKKRVLSEQKRQDIITQRANLNEELRKQQQSSIDQQNTYYNQLTTSLIQTGNALMINSINKELTRRRIVSNKFLVENSKKIEGLAKFHNLIKPELISKGLKDGLYNAHFIEQKSYSFSNNKISTESPCVVEVKDNFIVNLYHYGKKQFNSILPAKYSKQSKIENGFVQFNDYSTLSSYTVLIIEPYLSEEIEQVKLKEEGVGFLVFWSSDKDDVDKIINVQELDKNGFLVREFQAKIAYSKNDKEISNIDEKYKVVSNSGNEFLFFGQPTQLSFGEFSLYPKVNKKTFKEPLKDNEIRYVEIKKYRE